MILTIKNIDENFNFWFAMDHLVHDSHEKVKGTPVMEREPVTEQNGTAQLQKDVLRPVLGILRLFEEF